MFVANYLVELLLILRVFIFLAPTPATSPQRQQHTTRRLSGMIRGTDNIINRIIVSFATSSSSSSCSPPDGVIAENDYYYVNGDTVSLTNNNNTPAIHSSTVGQMKVHVGGEEGYLINVWSRSRTFTWIIT